MDVTPETEASITPNIPTKPTYSGDWADDDEWDEAACIASYSPPKFAADDIGKSFPRSNWDEDSEEDEPWDEEACKELYWANQQNELAAENDEVYSDS